MLLFGALVSFATILTISSALPSVRSDEPFFYKGFDLSSLKIMEDGGATYKDAQQGNITRPVEDILGKKLMGVRSSNVSDIR